MRADYCSATVYDEIQLDTRPRENRLRRGHVIKLAREVSYQEISRRVADKGLPLILFDDTETVPGHGLPDLAV